MEIVNTKKDEDLIVLSNTANDLRSKLTDSENVKKQLTNELKVIQEKSRVVVPQSS